MTPASPRSNPSRSPARLILMILFCWNACSCDECPGCCCYVIKAWIKCRGITLQQFPPPPAEDKESLRRWCNLTFEVTEIKTLDISGTCVSKIDEETLKNYSNVESLLLNHNKFKKLEENAFFVEGRVSRVTTINLRNNGLESVNEKAFAGLQNLTVLDLSWNRISKLSPGVFYDLHNLEELRLEGNDLVDLNMDVFRDLRSLKDLVVSSNYIEKVGRFPSSAVSLTKLDLRNNSITSLEKNTFSKLKNLGDIDLSQNKLTRLPAEIFASNEDLYKIDLSKNQLLTLDENFGDLCWLEMLDLRENKLTTASYTWFATVAKHRDNGKEIRESPTNGGNSWECNKNENGTAEYALFLTTICNDSRMKRNGLVKYFNVICAETGKFLVNSSNCASDYLPSEKTQSAIRARNENGTCHDHVMCPFKSPKCVGMISPTISDFNQPFTDIGITKTMIIFSMFGGLVMVVLVLVGYTYARRRQRKKRHHSESSIDSEIAYSESAAENDSILAESLENSSEWPGKKDNVFKHQDQMLVDQLQPNTRDDDKRFPVRNDPNMPTLTPPNIREHMTPAVVHWPQCSACSGTPSEPATDSSELPSPDSFQFESRLRPEGSSECNSTTQSVTPSVSGRDDTESDRCSTEIETRVKDPISVVNVHSRSNENEVDSAPLMLEAETQVKDPVAVSPDGNTEPKEYWQACETRPKNAYVQQPTNKEKAKNVYENWPSKMQATKPPTSEPTNLDPTYTPMKSQIQNFAPPIPPRMQPASLRPSQTQNIPDHFNRPMPQLPFQTIQVTHAPPGSLHQYFSIPNGQSSQNLLPVLYVPAHNCTFSNPNPDSAGQNIFVLGQQPMQRHDYQVEIPCALPPHPGPNPGCYIKHPENPIHVSEVVYRDSNPMPPSQKTHARPRSDREPLLEVVESAQNGKEKIKNKKKDKAKNKMKKT